MLLGVGVCVIYLVWIKKMIVWVGWLFYFGSEFLGVNI